MLVRSLIAFFIALCAAAAAAPAAGAATGQCTPDSSARCNFWTGKTTFVADGDTIEVRIPGVGVRRIRLTGINAMEQTRYSHYPARRRGHCHALAATSRLEGLIRSSHGLVRLAAQNPGSVAGNRLRRQVSVRIGGQWLDTGAILVAEGHALWLPNGVEHAWNRTYSRLAETAASQHLRLWNPSSCGAGPNAAVQPLMRLKWDADGNDGANPNGEWARIVNPSGTAIRIGHWRFRDSSARFFTFPRGAVIPAGGSVTVHVGRGRNTGRQFYWGLSSPAFENASSDRRAMGDGGYLFDPKGNLRAFAIYPRRA